MPTKYGDCSIRYWSGRIKRWPVVSENVGGPVSLTTDIFTLDLRKKCASDCLVV